MPNIEYNAWGAGEYLPSVAKKYGWDSLLTVLPRGVVLLHMGVLGDRPNTSSRLGSLQNDEDVLSILEQLADHPRVLYANEGVKDMMQKRVLSMSKE